MYPSSHQASGIKYSRAQAVCVVLPVVRPGRPALGSNKPTRLRRDTNSVYVSDWMCALIMVLKYLQTRGYSDRRVIIVNGIPVNGARGGC